MEFFVIFLVTLAILIGLVLALSFGKAPAYRPSRKGTLELLFSVVEKQQSESHWQLFLSNPITHDPELEQIRLQCLEAVEVFEHVDGNKKLAQIKEVASSLQRLIENEPATRIF